MNTTPQEKYEEFRDRFRRMTDKELTSELECDKSKPGWTNSRAYFYAALRDEYKARSLYYPG